MTDTNKTTAGGCLCGKVRFSLADAPSEYTACHCGMCRKTSGGVQFGIHIQPGGITWTADETLAVYPSSQWAERGFCSTCGSSLFWRMTAPGPMTGMLILNAGALDAMDGMALTSEIYIDNKPKGHAFAGDHERLTEAEFMAQMGGVDG